MKIQMSKREKVMVLFATVIVVTFFALRFLIIPVNDSYRAMTEKLETLAYEKTALQARLNSEHIIRASKQDAQEAAESLKLIYPTALSSYEADRMLTELCRESGLTPVTLQISDARYYITQPDKSEEPSHNEEEFPPAFSVVSANMGLNGSYEALKNLVDAVSEIDYLRLDRVSFTDESDMGRAGAPNIAVTFEISIMNEVDR